MSIIYKTLERPEDPRTADSPKRYYPQIITLGKSVKLPFITEKIHERSSLSKGDIKSCIQNFVDQVKEQLLEGKSVNVDGLGVFSLSAKSKGEKTAKEVTADSVMSLRICFQANKELKLSKAATRADEQVDLISLDEYLKGVKLINVSDDSDDSNDSGSGSGGEGDLNDNPLG